MFVFDDERNYKNCKMKQYDAYVCMPPKGMIIFNYLEHSPVIAQLKNLGVKGLVHDSSYTWFMMPEKSDNGNFSDEFWQNVSKESYDEIVSIIQNSNMGYVVSEAQPFVLAGTCGELSVISPSELAQNYNFLQGNQPVGINQQNLNQRMTGEYLKWTLVRLKPSMVNYMACRVPTSIHTNIQTKLGMQSINAQGVSHGKGDFVVCNKLPNGKPDFSTRFIVNGNVFASTFNNQGWQDSIKDAKTVNISNLPNLVPNDVVAEKPIDAKSFRDKCDTLMKELQKIYKFTVSSNNYELVKDYRGIAKEVTFKGDTYVAKFTVNGNFSHTYHGKSGDNEVKANETFVYFGCSTHQDSALFMSIHPKTDNIYLTGWTFPSKGSESRSGYDYPKSKVGGISSINCAEEAKYFLNNNKGADYFIDNRGTDKNKNEEDNGEPIDAKAFRDKCDTLMKELQKVFKFKVISNNYEVVDNYTGLAHEFKFDGKTYVAKYMVGGEFTHTPSSGNEFKVDKTAVWFGCSAHHRDSALTISMHPDIDGLYLSGWVFPHKRSKCMTGDLYPHCTSGTILTMNCAEEVQMFVDGCKCCDYIDNREAYNDVLPKIRDTFIKRVKSGTYTWMFVHEFDEKKFKIEDGTLYMYSREYVKYHDSKKEKLDLLIYFSGNTTVYKTVSSHDTAQVYKFLEEFSFVRKCGYESAFRTPACSVNVLNAIKEFSGSGYQEMNHSLSNNDLSDLSMDMYFNTIELYDYLSKCRTRGITLFRGFSSDEDFKVGKRIPCNRFTSLSLSMFSADMFGNCLFIFKNVNIEGAYINSFSCFRDREYEVLMNAGYDIVLKENIGEHMFICTLEKNDFELNRDGDFEDIDIVLMSALSSSKVILDSFTISQDSDKGLKSTFVGESVTNYYLYGRLNSKVKISIAYKKDKLTSVSVTVAYPDKGVKSTEIIKLGSSDLKNTNVNDLVYNLIIPKLEAWINEYCTSDIIADSTFKYLSLLFYGITLAFQREGYVILNSVFDEYDRWDEKTSYGGKLTINGDNDDKIVLHFKLDTSNNFHISARGNGRKANKVVQFDGEDINGLCNNVYNLVVRTFSLNQFNRVEKAVKLACRYLKCEGNLVSTQDVTQVYMIKGREMHFSVSFGKINIDNKIELNYFDNLRTIASKISSIIKE